MDGSVHVHGSVHVRAAPTHVAMFLAPTAGWNLVDKLCFMAVGNAATVQQLLCCS